MEFIPVPGKDGILMCRVETRKRDYRTYTQETGYKQTGPILVAKLKEGSSGQNELGLAVDPSANWDSPGFDQSEDDPVVGINYNEAQDFCRWLSKGEGLNFRLPRDEEWSAAVGDSKYPWGAELPPPNVAGNFFDRQAIQDFYGAVPSELTGYYNDGFGWTSPVGSFGQNSFGFSDLGGNVWEWCEELYLPSMNESDMLEAFPFLKEDRTGSGVSCRVLRGGSWYDQLGEPLRSSVRLPGVPTQGANCRGFRCILETGARE